MPTFASFPDRDTGPAHSRRAAQQGFTLVELMVVLVLIGLAVSVVMLSARGSDAAVSDEAARLALRLAGARDRAIVDGRSTRIEFVADGYRFAQRRSGAWQPTTDRALRPAALPDDVRLSASRARLAFDPSGLPDGAAEIILSTDGARAAVRVDPAGGVDVTR